MLGCSQWNCKRKKIDYMHLHGVPLLVRRQGSCLNDMSTNCLYLLLWKGTRTSFEPKLSNEQFITTRAYLYGGALLFVPRRVRSVGRRAPAFRGPVSGAFFSSDIGILPADWRDETGAGVSAIVLVGFFDGILKLQGGWKITSLRKRRIKTQLIVSNSPSLQVLFQLLAMRLPQVF